MSELRNIGVTLGTTSHFEGIILGNTLIAMNWRINKRKVEIAATLQSSTVVKPN